MDVKIENIDTEEFKTQLTAALTKSAIGNVFYKLIENAANDYKVKQIIEECLRQEVRQRAREYFNTNPEVQAAIQKKVAEMFTAELVDQLADRIKVDRY